MSDSVSTAAIAAVAGVIAGTIGSVVAPWAIGVLKRNVKNLPIVES